MRARLPADDGALVLSALRAAEEEGAAARRAIRAASGSRRRPCDGLAATLGNLAHPRSYDHRLVHEGGFRLAVDGRACRPRSEGDRLDCGIAVEGLIARALAGT